MPWTFNVPMPDGSAYVLTKLLAKGQQNPKTAKSDARQDKYLTYSQSLAPANASGFNLCSSSSHGCRTGCLFTSGHAAIFPTTIQPSRIAKARFFKLYTTDFIARLKVELTSANRRAKKLGKVLCVRLNVLSDVMWEKVAPSIFSDFPDVVFYDYTKHKPRMMRYLSGQLPTNYHLTFSWSENNEQACLEVLRSNGNVAVPFHVKYSAKGGYKPLPAKFLGHPVIDGDQTDLRFLEGNAGQIIGLRAKGRAKLDLSTGFVVSLSDRRVA